MKTSSQPLKHGHIWLLYTLKQNNFMKTHPHTKIWFHSYLVVLEREEECLARRLSLEELR